jgi:hypothetical protein
MNQLSLLESLEKSSPKLGTTDFIKSLIEFDNFGKRTEIIKRGDINYYINEYWTSGQRRSHSIHEISYRACFKAQLPEFFIDRLTEIGDIVHDPFMGRGTTPIQASLMGRRGFGNDINPLSVLLTRPRLHPIQLKELQKLLFSVDINGSDYHHSDLLAFYHPKTLAGLEKLKEWIFNQAPLNLNNPDPVVDWIRMVAINRLSGHSPGFFSGRSMPPNQAVSIKAQLKINEKLGVSPPERNIKNIILKKSQALLKDGFTQPLFDGSFFVGSAWSTPDIKDNSVQLVVTSPPFLDIVHYAADNWLRCWFAGIDHNKVNIAMHKTKESWTEMVHSVLIEQCRILKSGGFVAFEVGEVRNKTVLLEELVWSAADGLAFDKIGVMVNEQDFTKTANCWGVDNGKKGTNTNRIVILRKH